MSRPVSKPSAAKTAAIVSTGGWLEMPDIDETHVSNASAPFFAAARYEATASPPVMCECICRGIETADEIAFERRAASAGVSIPAMSLMQRESAPRASRSFAKET